METARDILIEHYYGTYRADVMTFSWKVISSCLQLGDHSHATHETRRASLLTSFRKVVALRIFFNYSFENTINKRVYPDDIDQLTKLRI